MNGQQGAKDTSKHAGGRHGGGMGGGRHGGGMGGMAPGEKAKDFKGTIKRLALYLSQNIAVVIFVFLFAIGGVVLNVQGPKILGKATDKITSGYIEMTMYDSIAPIIPTNAKLPANTHIQDIPDLFTYVQTVTTNMQNLSAAGASGTGAAATTAQQMITSPDQIPDAVMTGVPDAWQPVVKSEIVMLGYYEAVTAGSVSLADVPAAYQAGVKYLQTQAASSSGGVSNMQSSDLQSKINDALKSVPDSYLSAVENLDLSAGRPGIDFAGIVGIAVELLCIYGGAALLMIIQGVLMVGVTQRTVYRLRRDVYAKLQRMPMKFFDTHTHGEILSRVANDIDNIANTLQQSLSQIITSICTIVGIFVMMLTISGWLSLISLATIPISLGITMIVIKNSQKHFTNNWAEIGNINGQVEEMYTGQKIVKAYGYEEKSIEIFDATNARLFTAGWKSQFFSGIIMPLLNFVNNLGYVAICVVGGALTFNGQLTLGGIQAFIAYQRQFTQPISTTASMMNVLQSTAASAERVFELLDEEEEIPDAPDAIEITNPKGQIQFNHVRFGYSDDSILMQDMNIDVQPGQTIAIVGPTGAGKTTFVNLLMRFYEIQGGQILVDGEDITKVKRASLRSLFGMVLQDTWLFTGTIAENIAYGREGSSMDDVIQAADAAYVDHFTRTLSEGYETVINEEANNISQGQRQLLTIARAALADPPILILDEATSSVDTRTEVHIQKAMAKLLAGRTSFVIAHRLSTIKGADLILVMNHGTIVEQGTHEELMAKNGFYADLYNSQFSGDEESA